MPPTRKRNDEVVVIIGPTGGWRCSSSSPPPSPGTGAVPTTEALAVEPNRPSGSTSLAARGRNDSLEPSEDKGRRCSSDEVVDVKSQLRLAFNLDFAVRPRPARSGDGTVIHVDEFAPRVRCDPDDGFKLQVMLILGEWGYRSDSGSLHMRAKLAEGAVRLACYDNGYPTFRGRFAVDSWFKQFRGSLPCGGPGCHPRKLEPPNRRNLGTARKRGRPSSNVGDATEEDRRTAQKRRWPKSGEEKRRGEEREECGAGKKEGGKSVATGSKVVEQENVDDAHQVNVTANLHSEIRNLRASLREAEEKAILFKRLLREERDKYNEERDRRLELELRLKLCEEEDSVVCQRTDTSQSSGDLGTTENGGVARKLPPVSKLGAVVVGNSSSSDNEGMSLSCTPWPPLPETARADREEERITNSAAIAAMETKDLGERTSAIVGKKGGQSNDMSVAAKVAESSSKSSSQRRPGGARATLRRRRNLITRDQLRGLRATGGRLCGDLDELQKHASSVQYFKNSGWLCVACGEPTKHKCTECGAWVHFFPIKGKVWKKDPDQVRLCFLQAHNDLCAGRMRSDMDFYGKDVSDWRKPTAKELRQNAQHIKRIDN